MLHPEVTQRRLPQLYFDYFPIFLESARLGSGKKPFRFENMWLKEKGFMDMVRERWRSYVFMGSPRFVLSHKLKSLKQDLKVCLVILVLAKFL